MKVFALATVTAAILLLVTGGVLIWQTPTTEVYLELDSESPLADQSDLNAQMPSEVNVQALQASSPSILAPQRQAYQAGRLTSAEVEGALALLKQDAQLTEMELAVLAMALYQRHEDPALAASYEQAMQLALEGSQLKHQIDAEASLAFKGIEKKILKEIMEMESIPNGLSPNEYLQQRMEELRKTVLAGGALPAMTGN